MIRKKSLGLGVIWVGLLIGCLLLNASSVFAEGGFRPHYPDVFARDDISIEPDLKIGMLLVTGGNATVSGIVEKGIVVVDGNLFLTSDALVKGTVVVLGGYVRSENGARIERTMVALAPGKIPVAKFLVLGLLFLSLSSLLVFPVVLWFTARIAIRSQLYLWVKERLLLLERNESGLYIAFALSIGALLLTFFAEIAYETFIRRQMDIFDNVLVWLVRYLASPTLDRVMIVISEFGYGYPFWIIILVVVLSLVYYRLRLEVQGVLVSLVGGALLNLMLKSLFERSRPDLLRVVEEAGYSFPSGHAMISLCFYGMIAFLLARHVTSWRWRLIIIVSAVVLVAIIGISRVYLGVHYPTDVVAGYFAGGMWLAFCISLLIWWERGSLGE